MKTIIISLLLFFTVNAQNVWYVDRDATGANTGRSWANAWNTLDSSIWLGNQGVNWAIIQPGDTIYVSGGTDSTRYIPSNHNWYNGIRREASEGEITPTFSQTVVITKAWHPNHNGEVYFTPKNDNTYNIFVISGVNNVKISGVKFVETRSNNTPQTNGLINIYGSDNTIENCLIYNRGLTTGVYLAGKNLTLRNNYFDYEENALDNDIDPIGAAEGDGSGMHLIEGNRIIIRNTSLTTSSHRDGVQIANVGVPNSNANSLDMVIRNNIIIVAGAGTGWNGMVYSSGPWTNVTWYIYNNIFVARNTEVNIGVIFTYQLHKFPEYPQWMFRSYIFNNTIIMNDEGTGLSTPITLESGVAIDTVFIKNNLIIADAPINYFLNMRYFYEGTYFREVDYNGYFEYGGLSGNFYSGEGFGGYSYAQWQNMGYNYDAHSITGNSTAVTFSNKYGENRSDYYTETGRNLGVNIGETRPDLLAKFPDIAYDILGNPRTGSWDMGALEYQGSQTNYIDVKSKVLLQGPFNSNLMNTNLSQNSLLPNTQPFNTAPWNYDGSESLSSGASSSFVDWVLVELRSSSNPTQVVARKAAILKNDGSLLNTDGNIGVPFSNIQAGSYYIAVFHRNHLAVMSTAPVQLSANTPTYDFTTGMNKAYGQNPMKELAPGKYGMFAGDGNSNGGITIADRNEVWAPQNGSMGYLKGDFNLDGGVTASDVNLYWNLNNGTMTQVP